MIHLVVKKFFISLVVFFFCGMIFFQYVLIVHAESIGIAVDQTSIAFDIDSGETEEFVITLTNVSDQTQNVTMGALDYELGDDNDIRLRDQSDEGNGVRDWISVENPQITLAPQESQEVIFTFRAPDTAPVGSHRGAVFFRTALDASGDVNVEGQIAVHVLVNVKGDTHASGRLSAFDIPFFSMGTVTYQATFENLGNIHYVPYGEVIVKNIFTKNEKMYKYPKHFVFPERSFTFSLSDDIPSIAGFYRAQANFVDGEGVVRSRSDYVMGPLFPIVFCVAGVMIFALFRWIYALRSGNQKKRLEHHQKKRQSLNLQKLFDQKKEYRSLQKHKEKEDK